MANERAQILSTKFIAILQLPASCPHLIRAHLLCLCHLGMLGAIVS